MVKNVKETIQYMNFLKKIINNEIEVSPEILDFNQIHENINIYNELREEIRKFTGWKKTE